MKSTLKKHCSLLKLVIIIVVCVTYLHVLFLNCIKIYTVYSYMYEFTEAQKAW